jgi:hypothetical protein
MDRTVLRLICASSSRKIHSVIDLQKNLGSFPQVVAICLRVSVMLFWKKLTQPHIWERLFYERLTEPIHLNLLSLGVLSFGSFRQKVKWDLVVRQQNAFSILKAADQAKVLGFEKVTLVEFGVATGAGLMNMAKIAERVTKATGIHFKIYGFDTGKGMPPARDYRDHPDMYGEGDFVMDVERLRRTLPANVELRLGPISDTVQAFLADLPANEPIGYVVVDVDYYYSAVDALGVLAGTPQRYLPLTPVYLDDIWCERHNSACGELLAVAEFNRDHPLRRIERHPFLEQSRIFRRARWLGQVFYCHVLDHPQRETVKVDQTKRQLENIYL